jgi:hypothetical protein
MELGYDRINQWKVKAPGVLLDEVEQLEIFILLKKIFGRYNTALYIKEFHGNYERCFFTISYYSLIWANTVLDKAVPTLNRNNVHSVKVWFPKSQRTTNHRPPIRCPAGRNAKAGSHLSAKTFKFGRVEKERVAKGVCGGVNN